jgi:cell division protease FtsH
MFIPEKDYSPETAHVIDQEVRTLIDGAYADARHMIEQHWDKVVAISEALLSVETLSREDVDRIMAGEPFQKPSVADLLKRELPKNPAAQNPGTGTEPREDLPPGALPTPA